MWSGCSQFGAIGFRGRQNCRPTFLQLKSESQRWLDSLTKAAITSPDPTQSNSTSSSWVELSRVWRCNHSKNSTRLDSTELVQTTFSNDPVFHFTVWIKSVNTISVSLITKRITFYRSAVYCHRNMGLGVGGRYLVRLYLFRPPYVRTLQKIEYVWQYDTYMLKLCILIECGMVWAGFTVAS